MLFTGSAKVDVGGLVATSQVVDADHFQRTGNFRFGGGEAADARVVNQGEITIGEKGLGALVGSDVENAGAIVAKRGTVALASGERTTIDFAGDGVVQIAVDGDAPGGRVTQSGMIDVGGGRVVLSAGGAADALDNVINTSGLTRASSGTGKGGRVELVGRGAGKVEVSGRVEANGATEGGRIEVTGDLVRLRDSAALQADGRSGGGEVLVGGGYQGGGELRHARQTALQSGSRVSADGGEGAGGTVIAWSDEATWFNGRISVTGTAGGGLVETSSKGRLGVGDQAEVTAGPGGSWLLDPRDILIVTRLNEPPPSGFPPPDASGAPYLVSVSALEQALANNTAVTIATDPSDTTSPGNGDITTEANTSISWNTTADLELNAAGSINLNGRITSRGGGDFIGIAAGDINIVNTGNRNFVNFTVTKDPANITLEAQGDLNIDGAIVLNSGGRLIGRAGGVIGVTENIAVAGADNALTGITLESLGAVAGASDIVLSAAVGTADGGDIDLTSAGSIILTAASASGAPGVVDSLNVNLGTRLPGAISITATDSIELQAGARLDAQNGGDLTMGAATQTWDGVVAAGSGSDDGGNVLLRGAITSSVSPLFSLAPGNNFALLSFGGQPASYTSSAPFEVTTSGGSHATASGVVTIGGPVDAPDIDILSDAGVILQGSGTSLTGTGPGDAVVVAAGERFDNFSGAGTGTLAVTDPGARWLLYIDTFAGLNGPAPAPRGYDLYNRPYETSPPTSLSGSSGNRIVYGEQPLLVLTADNATKGYGEDVTGMLTYSVSHIDSDTGPGGAPGFRDGDSDATALTGAPTLTSAGPPASASVGSYPIDVLAAASDQGYLLQTASGALIVDPAQLTITADDQTKTYGQSFVFNGTEFTAAGLMNADTVDSVVLASAGATATATVAGSPYAIGASSAQGTGLGNYTIGYEDGALRVSPAATATATGSPHSIGASSTQATGLANYTIGYEDGALRVSPAALVITANDRSNVAPAVLVQPPPTDTSGFLTAATRRFRAGAPPLTPGDASFRTTDFDAPLALSDPFILSYSLGELVQSAPDVGAGSRGFGSAEGALVDDGNQEAGCSGPANLGGGDLDCVPSPESYWTTR